jgi:hypothetical protein
MVTPTSDTLPPVPDGPRGEGGARTPLAQRLGALFLKPPGEPTRQGPPEGPGSAPELRPARGAEDKERLLGLLLAPLAAAISLLIVSALIANDPPARLANGTADRLHVSVSLYYELAVVLVVVSVLMLAMAWFRQRLYLGMVMALYGLAVFNLHYWGFGIPYLLVGAWLLVRSYRVAQELKRGEGPRPEGDGRRRGRPSGRYTPPRRRRPAG